MANEVSIDVPTLLAGADRCREFIEHTRNAVKQVEQGKVQVTSHWKGPAATTFARVVTAWEEAAGKLMTAAGDAADLMTKTAKGKEAMEDQQNSMLGGFEGLINI